MSTAAADDDATGATSTGDPGPGRTESRLAGPSAGTADGVDASPVTGRMALRDGRTLAVSDDDGVDLVEVRGADGGIEVRILLTDKGPVLHMEAARLSLKADGAVEVDAGSFRVRTADDLVLEAGGGVAVEGGGDVRIDGAGDVRVAGSMIYLN